MIWLMYVDASSQQAAPRALTDAALLQRCFTALLRSIEAECDTQLYESVVKLYALGILYCI